MHIWYVLLPLHNLVRKILLILIQGGFVEKDDDDNDVYYGPRNKGTNRRFRGQPFSLQRGCKNEVISLVELLLTHVLIHIAAATAFLEAVWSPNAFQVTKKKKMTSIASGIITSGNESDQYSNNNCRRVSLVIENNAFHPLLRRSLEDVSRGRRTSDNA